MIRVNLLRDFGKITVDNIQVIDEDPISSVGFVKNLFVMLLGVGVLFAHEMINIPELTGQLAAINAEIAEATRFNQKMDSLKREIERYEKDLKRLNAQTQFLQRVQKERMLSVDLINKMKDNIPEKVWLTAIQTVGNSIEIKGEAEGNGDVNEFNNRLATAPFLKDVVIVSSTLNINTRMNIQDFIIRASFIDGKQLLGEDEPVPEVVEPPSKVAPTAAPGSGQ